MAEAKRAAAERLETEQKITSLAVTRAQAKIDATNKANARLEAETKATEAAVAKARAESATLAIISKRVELEEKARDEATQREIVERMANEAIIARTEENKKATVAATARIRAALATTTHPKDQSSIPLLSPDAAIQSIRATPDQGKPGVVSVSTEKDSISSAILATTRSPRNP